MEESGTGRHRNGSKCTIKHNSIKINEKFVLPFTKVTKRGVRSWSLGQNIRARKARKARQGKDVAKDCKGTKAKKRTRHVNTTVCTQMQADSTV